MWKCFPTLAVSLLVTLTAATETLVDSFPCPADQPRGLAWDGEYLWCADAETDSFYKLDSSTGAVIGGILSPLAINPEYGGITCSNEGDIWFANGQYVYKLDSETGDVLTSFSCPGG